MTCPNCNSTSVRKNGNRKGRQCYQCKSCGRQFLESYKDWKYPEAVKQLCLKMYLNGMGLRGIERVTEIHHTTVMGVAESVMIFKRLFTNKIEFKVSHLSDFIMESATPCDARSFGKPLPPYPILHSLRRFLKLQS